MRKKREIKFGKEQKCKNCDKMIPIPMVYCSSICWRECNDKCEVIYVIDKKDICCPKCLKELPSQMIESAPLKEERGTLRIHETHCPYCKIKIELRFRRGLK